MKEQNQIEIYQANDGTTQIKVQFEQDTVRKGCPHNQ